MHMDTNGILLGAIAGDVIGSYYEHFRTKNYNFELFRNRSKCTDDTKMTVAVLSDNPLPYNSWGNGSAMRVSPVGWAFDTLEETLEAAKQSAEVTHNHPEGIKGAQATAACIFLARTGKSKEEIRNYVEQTFGYDLHRTCDEIRPNYQFEVSCQKSVPESIIAFLESSDYESAIRLAVSMGGDADTMGAIAGGIAEAFYGGVPEHIKAEVINRLPDEFVQVMKRFYSRFVV